MKSLVSKVTHSIMLRLAVIVAAMGVMIGAAVYVSWTVFQSIETEMRTMADDRLPQLRAGAGITRVTDETRAVLSNTLSASTLDELTRIQQEKEILLTEFRGALEQLPDDNRAVVSALLDDGEAALLALLNARRAEKQASAEALSALDVAFQNASAVSARLEEATDTALFDMILSGEDATASMDETLTALVERDFAQFQVVLDIQSQVNLLSGLGLATRSGSGFSTQTITDDLAMSALDRLEGSLAIARDIDALSDVSAVVEEALAAFQGIFADGARPLSPNEILGIRLEIDSVLSPAVDDAYFNLLIGSEEAKETSKSALTTLMETEVSAMRDMSYLDAATKNFFSLALKAALAQGDTDLSLAQAELLAQETIVRSLIESVSDADILNEVENLLSLARAEEGIAAQISAVFAARSAATVATDDASRVVSAIASETASISAASIASLEESASALGAKVEQAGVQIWQIGAAGLIAVLIAPLFVWALVTRPLNRVTSVTERLARGDLSEINGLRQNAGELGRLATALHVFRANALQTIEMAEQEKQRDQEAREKEQAAEKAMQEAAEAEKRRQRIQEEETQKKAVEARRKMIGDLNASIGSVVSAASEGDFSTRVNVEFEDSELAALAGSVNVLVESVEKGLAATTHVLSRVAGGDLSEGMSGDFSGDFQRLKEGTNGMIEALCKLVAEISSSGNNLAASSAELSDTSDSLSRQAEQNAASLEETSAALEELSASIKQVSGSAEEANDSARDASATAKSSGEVAADAAASMERISDASKEITQTVDVINDIAFQINLLALNAGVEAARAGDAGRGFSVVASEVRQLAQRASEAAKEIEAVIERSDNAVSEGVEKVGKAQSSLARISESVVAFSGRVEDISRAISEQVHGVKEITNAVSQIDQNTQKQAASFEEVTAASRLLAQEAEGLTTSTAKFTIGAEETPMFVARPKSFPTPQTSVKKAVGAGDMTSSLAPSDDGWDEF